MRKAKYRGGPVRRSKIAGFTLIEVLVTVVILVIGVLGFTALQISSVSSAVSTRHLDSCVNVAFDVLDRVRANIGRADFGTDFTISPQSGCPGDGGEGDAICNAMIDMQFSGATLTVSFQQDTPLNLLDTVTAQVTYSHKGVTRSCNVMEIMNTE